MSDPILSPAAKGPAPHPGGLTQSIADPSAPTTGQPDAATPAAPVTGTGRYALGEEIAHGGMGVIYRATDTALGREVAVKVLHERFPSNSGVASRFADEARITAQLQHPAIPPVHDLGTLPDGRPFLVMKLIKGSTLEELLAARADPSVDRGRFVAVFEQVCQAVAYAHAHDVLHRDLKPANVMVGAFGEVQLMDWGLAKVVSDRPAETTDPQETRAATLVVSLRDSDGSSTQAGSVLGTPAFMAPEQAVGAVGKVDQRSDVFGLGAILAVILTDKPPFAAESAETMRVKAAQGDVTECLERLDSCGAEPELVALCKRCLSPRASERPANGKEVAQAVADLRQAAEERAHAAERERIATELRVVEERKRRRVQRALAAAIGLLFLGGLAFGAWQIELRRADRERRSRASEETGALLRQCEQALRAGNTAEAARRLESARKRAAGEGFAEHAELRNRCEQDLAVLGALDRADQLRWTPVLNPALGARTTEENYYAALSRFFNKSGEMISSEVPARLADSAVRDRVVSALDWLLQAKRTDPVRSALRLLDPDPFRDAVRDAVRAKDRAKLAKLAAQAEALNQPDWFLSSLGECEAVGLARRRELLLMALQRRPGDVPVLMALGKSYPAKERQGAEERVRWYQAAIAVAPANLAAYLNLGLALEDKGDTAGAVTAFRQTLRLNSNVATGFYSVAISNPAFQQALRLEPALAVEYLMKLAKELEANWHLDEAVAAWQLAQQLVDSKSIRLSNIRLSNIRLGLANALRQKGDFDGAIAVLRQAIPPNSPNLGISVALANVLVGKGDLDGAIDVYQQLLQGAIADPQSPGDNRAIVLNFLGVALLRKGDLDGAVAAFQQALQRNPKNPLYRRNLGRALEDKGDLDGAIAAYTELDQLAPQPPGPLPPPPGLAPQPPGLTPQSREYSKLQKRAQQMRDLLPRLPAVLAGAQQPQSPGECCDVAELCQRPFQKRYAAAARFYADAFAADPKLAEDLQTSNRYNAACAAALAGCGKGADTVGQEDKDKARLRTQALQWLRADLILLRRRAESDKVVPRQQATATLSRWLKDPDFVGVRPGQKRIAMPAEERAAWDALWADVKATLALARKAPTSTSGK
jgi:tetratricopeptide (TPR) repeat protein